MNILAGESGPEGSGPEAMGRGMNEEGNFVPQESREQLDNPEAEEALDREATQSIESLSTLQANLGRAERSRLNSRDASFVADLKGLASTLYNEVPPDVRTIIDAAVGGAAAGAGLSGGRLYETGAGALLGAGAGAARVGIRRLAGPAAEMFRSLRGVYDKYRGKAAA